MEIKLGSWQYLTTIQEVLSCFLFSTVMHIPSILNYTWNLIPFSKVKKQHSLRFDPYFLSSVTFLQVFVKCPFKLYEIQPILSIKLNLVRLHINYIKYYWESNKNIPIIYMIKNYYKLLSLFVTRDSDWLCRWYITDIVIYVYTSCIHII